MSNIVKLQILKAVKAGFTIPHLNPSMFLVSAVFSALMSTFMYFTTAFYQVGAEPDPISMYTGILSLTEYLVFTLLVGITVVIANALLSKMAFDSIKGKPEVIEAIALSGRKLLPLLAMHLLYFLIVLFGSLLLFIPGIFLSIMLVYSQYFILFENSGVINSFRQSWQIVRGNWWRTFAVFLIWGAIASVPALTINYSREVETIIYFVFYLLFYPWTASSLVNAYTQLRNADNSPTLPDAA